MPRVLLTRRQLVAFALFVLSASASCTSCCPSSPASARPCTASSAATAGGSRSASCSRCSSFAGYVVLFRAVFARRATGRIGWRESYQITMAGLAATRLFAAAGAGGVALTAWALRRSGMEPRLVACRMVAFMVLLYVVYAGSLLIDGIGLGTGLFPGGGSFAITIVPAIVAAVLFAAAGAIALLPDDLERRLQRAGRRVRARSRTWLARAAAVPALAASGVRTAIDADPHARPRAARGARVVGL